MATQSGLLDRVRDQLRTLHYSYRTEQQYLFWIRRFILFHGKRHPSEMAAPEVEGFLTHLAVERQVSASTQNQALAAILFLYQKVLQVQLPWLDGIVRAKRSRYLPVVLTTAEVRSILAQLDDEYWLIVNVLYGAGLRVREALQLRVKDVQFDYRQLVVRSGNGGKDRVTILPEALLAPLQKHLESVKARHQAAIHGGYAGVEMPYALERKYPNAHLEWAWQYVFPARRPSRDPRTGSWRRHHVIPETLQRRVKLAVKAAGVDKPVSCHTFRHCFATHLLERGYDIRTRARTSADSVRVADCSPALDGMCIFMHITQNNIHPTRTPTPWPPTPMPSFTAGMRSPASCGAPRSAGRPSWWSCCAPRVSRPRSPR